MENVGRPTPPLSNSDNRLHFKWPVLPLFYKHTLTSINTVFNTCSSYCSQLPSHRSIPHFSLHQVHLQLKSILKKWNLWMFVSTLWIFHRSWQIIHQMEGNDPRLNYLRVIFGKINIHCLLPIFTTRISDRCNAFDMLCLSVCLWLGHVNYTTYCVPYLESWATLFKAMGWGLLGLFFYSPSKTALWHPNAMKHTFQAKTY